MKSKPARGATIEVPDIPGPRVQLCWKQKATPPHSMIRCDRRRGHKGPHSWEYEAEKA
jgi:hypothetical protein